jgi:hypothetical protein
MQNVKTHQESANVFTPEVITVVNPAPVTVPRGRLLNMRVNDEEYERLARLAEHYGLNVSGVIRMLAKREAVALGLEPSQAAKPTPAKSRKR